MNTKYVIFLIIVVFIVVSATGILFKKQIIAQMNAWKLLPQPETFTELYFEDHLDLPKHLASGEQASFAFTVHNLEYEDVTYEYAVTATASGSATLMDTGSFMLKQDEYKTIPESFALKKSSARTQVTVTLKNKQQSIHFWIEPTP